MIRQAPPQMQPEYMEVPWEIFENNKLVTLTAAIIFMNQMPFIITYGKGVGLTVVEWIPNKMGTQLAKNVK